MMKKGFNIDVTQGQYMMLYNIMCEHNQMVNPQANPDFDLQDDYDLSKDDRLNLDELQIELEDQTVGVWEADDEDDLIEEITSSSGWCIKSIDYEIQLK